MPGFIWKKMVAIVPWVNFQLEQFSYVDHEANKAGTFTDYAELTYNGNEMWAQKVRITTVSHRLYVALCNFWRPGGITVLMPTSKNFFIRESVARAGKDDAQDHRGVGGCCYRCVMVENITHM